MNKDLTILLVEDDENTCSEIECAVEQYDGLRLAAITDNASEALELTQYHLPDVVILDIELHKGGGNGIMYLKQLSAVELNPMPFILVTTNNPSTVTHQIVKDLGADLTLTKTEAGYSSDYVVNMIHIMKDSILKTRKGPTDSSVHSASPEMLERKLKQRIHRELDLIGIHPKLTGYKYLVDSIILIYNKQESNISTILAKKYHKTSSSIERAMQNAINHAWDHTSIDDLLQYYTARIRPSKAVPTTMEFLYYYANKLENEL